ncbi:uncharacterized protein N7473_013125 [Penicillium subrubescens]|uniref:uncharacterized protein n=1 Tax=Penicillium subrubescens TaxID=1316194 RepID=UPI002544EC6B|nr:uncharacterized protein N7473_013125 [Penicillium subrubescens]KAJ5875012.1 hypothetical protein N7473_013125 [Penicillium subrubescens]
MSQNGQYSSEYVTDCPSFLKTDESDSSETSNSFASETPGAEVSGKEAWRTTKTKAANKPTALKADTKVTAPNKKVTAPKAAKEATAPNKKVTAPKAAKEATAAKAAKKVAAPNKKATAPKATKEATAPNKKVTAPKAAKEATAPNKKVTAPKAAKEATAAKATKEATAPKAAKWRSICEEERTKYDYLTQDIMDCITRWLGDWSSKRPRCTQCSISSGSSISDE